MDIQALRDWLHGRSVLVTGHTGFKGSWLTAWLSHMGANVTGLGLAPDQGSHSLFDRADIKSVCDSRIGDIRDQATVNAAFETKPELVFHLAAQALVRPAYADPLGTFSSNIMGTANVLEAARQSSGVRALVCVTTDKVYRNNELNRPFTETDELGGSDPYSASKAAAEMVTRAYMHTLVPRDGPMELAAARGGNVVGGGDWSKDRIIPDLIRAWHSGEPLVLRSPQAVRPWQHVLELCFGYILLAYRLEHGNATLHQTRHDYRGAWNFGPESGNEVPVSQLVNGLVRNLNQPDYPILLQSSALYESIYLRLDSTKSKTMLGWKPLLDIDRTIEWTVDWYRNYLDNPDSAAQLIAGQIADFEHLITSNIQV